MLFSLEIMLRFTVYIIIACGLVVTFCAPLQQSEQSLATITGSIATVAIAKKGVVGSDKIERFLEENVSITFFLFFFFLYLCCCCG